MKTLKELKKFYATTLLPDLCGLEKKRKKVLQKFIYVAVVTLCIVAPIIFFWAKSFQAWGQSIFVFVVLCIVAGAGLYRFISKDYVKEFKILVVDSIVRFVDENLTYSRKGHIPKSVFMSSGIFKTKPNIYKGDDLVAGKIGATKIQFSELDAKYESGSGKNRRVKTVFKGLFFIADFNKDFVGRTIVLPDTAEKLFGHVGKLLQSWNIARDQLIKLDDPEFEKYFVVYGIDQIQARYILSTSLMKRIVDFKEKTKRNIYLSFVGSKIFVAVSYSRNLFEPRIFKTLLDFGPVQEYFEDLQLATGIVDDLNLNTRIWSKQHVQVNKP